MPGKRRTNGCTHMGTSMHIIVRIGRYEYSLYILKGKRMVMNELITSIRTNRLYMCE